MPRARSRRGAGRGACSSRGKAKSAPVAETVPVLNFSSSLFGCDSGADLIYGTNLDVFQEVTIAEDEVPDINVESSSRSCTPGSVAADSCSNENSVCSLAATETSSRYWTREENLTPSAVPPDNLFGDEEMKSLNIDQDDVDLNDDVDLLFAPKEEPKTGPTKPKASEPAVVSTTSAPSVASAPSTTSTSSAAASAATSAEEKKAVTTTVRRRIKAEPTSTVDKELRPMTTYEEHLLHRKLRALSERGVLDERQRRLYRKLCLRNTKRMLGMAQFDLDCLMAKLTGREPTCYENVVASGNTGPALANVLDRFQRGTAATTSSAARGNLSFRMRLVGCEERAPQAFVSPYTGRTLKPFIRRDYESRPRKLKLLEEIRARRKDADRAAAAVRPIDYVYVQPHHIAAVSAMCREFFWPGIDLTECLEYPDFSCVVLYGHLIVGFAFMVPDVSYNEAYVSYLFTHPEWRGAGIATFMLYHLIQSCMGKDVTLHVAKDNPALNLYHKFGFKVEESVQDFYDKYLPADSTGCNHAFFMRLTR